MRNFNVELFKVLSQKVTFGKYSYVERIGIINLVRQSTSTSSSISYNGIEFFLKWPVWIRFHIDIVTYLEGSHIVRHVDLPKNIPGHEYRMVIVLHRAICGGKLLCKKFILNTSRLKIFNTREEHEVTKVVQGVRRVLLVGLFFRRTIGCTLF